MVNSHKLWEVNDPLIWDAEVWRFFLFLIKETVGFAASTVLEGFQFLTQRPELLLVVSGLLTMWVGIYLWRRHFRFQRQLAVNEDAPRDI